MYAVLVTVLLLILLYIGVRHYRYREGFTDHKEFANKQYTYYHESLDKAVFINPGIQPSMFNNVAKIPDLSIYFPKFKDYLPQFMIDNYDTYYKRDRDFCKKATHPRNLPKREPKAIVGCGWYFSPDPTIPSVPILGTSRAPLFSDNLPPNGTWMWSIRKAIEEEDIKYCSNIRTCNVMDVNGVRDVCGFCLSTGKSVPIDSNGNERYPNNPNGACGVKITRTANECFNPPRPPVYTSERINCGRYGYPSELNDIRLYRENECKALGGNWVNNGECIKPNGGSFSWDCRGLNAPKPVTVSVCTPNNAGKLSRDCLITLAKGVGFLPSGRILNMLTKSVSPTRSERGAINILASIGIAIPNSVLGGGDTDAVSAGNIYKRIMDQIQRGNTEQIKNAAKFLAIGRDSFVECDMDNDSDGPFAKYCLQQAFRQAGCQPAGSDYPKTDLHTDKVWSDVVRGFKDLYKAMDNHNDRDMQKEAIQKCLGITVPDMRIKCKK